MKRKRSTEYEYAPLDESKRQIRLLHLHPAEKLRHGRMRKIIECSFSLVSLDDEPQFEALSYVWGDKNDRMTIRLHGYPLSITRKLYDALLHMRECAKCVLWADALCIDQDDIEERASQVAQMGHIYATASRVVVYLGTWAPAAEAFSLIEVLGKSPEQHRYEEIQQGSKHPGSNLNTKLDGEKILSEFFELPWWKRLWTVQEFVLAKDVVFQSGYSLLAWGSLRDFAMAYVNHTNTCCNRRDFYNSNFGVKSNLFRVIELGIWRDSELRKEEVAHFAFAVFRTRQCSNPVDKIYGLLGLVNSSFSSKIRPDYSLTPREVYTKIALESILETQSLDILSHVYGKRSGSIHLPSYVPDWTAALKKDEAHCCLIRTNDLHLFSASRNSAVNVFIDVNLEAVTQIVAVETILDVHVTRSQTLGSGFLGEGRRFRSACSSNPALARAYLRALCGGIVRDGSEKGYRLVQDHDYAVFPRWQAPGHSGRGDAAFYAGETYKIATKGRLFAITRTWGTCMVPEGTAEGDVVVLMSGGKVPYILRKLEGTDEQRTGSKHNGERYQFLGGCYVDGIMHGGAWDESKLQKIILV